MESSNFNSPEKDQQEPTAAPSIGNDLWTIASAKLVE